MSTAPGKNYKVMFLPSLTLVLILSSYPAPNLIHQTLNLLAVNRKTQIPLSTNK